MASGSTFLDSIELAVQGRPHAAAVRQADREISYEALWSASGALAERLRRHETRQDDPGLVLVEGERSIELVIALIGVLRAGMGCVPVDLALPPGRQARIVASVGAAHRVVVSPGDSADPFELIARPGGAEPVRLPDRRTPGDAPAYVLFTSGSTGEPKGIVLGRRSLTALIRWHEETDRTAAGHVTAQLAPATFDVYWQEILATLATGGTLLVLPDSARRDPVALLGAVEAGGVRRLFLPTALLQPVAAAARTIPTPSLRDVIVAGSQLRITQDIRSWFSSMDGCRLHNHYGPTESHVVTSHTLVGDPVAWADVPPIGLPLPHVSVRLVSDELWIGGPALADGYLGQPGWTAERFLEVDGERWYLTGDRVTSTGEVGILEHEGRIDRQCKIDGHRIEPAEVEAHLLRSPDLVDAHVRGLPDGRGGNRLVAYVVASDDADPQRPDDELLVARELSPPWRAALARELPTPAVPSVWVRLRSIPLSINGKVDPSRLPEVPRGRPDLARAAAPPRTPTERFLAEIWEEHLDLDGIGRDDNFFDLGGTSLRFADVATEIRRRLDLDLPLTEMYEHPTVSALARHLDHGTSSSTPPAPRPAPGRSPVAVVGLSCRFPGAPSIEAFWDVLREGRDTITRRSDRPDTTGRVVAAGVLPDIDRFDAGLFGYTPAQARIIDPQHRLFLECCWEALQDASCDPERFSGSVGAFGGCGTSTYLLNNLTGDALHSMVTSSSEIGLLLGNDKDFLTARASYALDLRGPSLNVNAACATGLFAVHEAVRSLQDGACDVALAGAASIQVPQLTGYLHEEGMPLSPDGRCRAFDRDAAGTVFGSGVGVVALKRLDDALADGDDVYAVILGTGTSNDGAQKVGMAAPSVQGQARAIRNALDAGDVDPATIRYVEGHGTGTAVGDPIEVAALQQAYGDLPKGSCGLGSVKANVGHLGWAAGMAGLIKAILVLRNRWMPPTINFRAPNPELRIEETSFAITDRSQPFPAAPGRDRVAVSAFGLGGSNAHALLEAAPLPKVTSPALDAWQVLPLSARSERALEGALALIEQFDATRAPVRDLARTLSLGRPHHPLRRAIVVAPDEAVSDAIQRCTQRPRPASARPGLIVAIFPGHGAERVGLGAELYRSEPTFRDSIDLFDDLVRSKVGRTVGDLLYRSTKDDGRIDDVVEVHAVVFALQTALVHLWESKGFFIDVLLGHSLGEYAAACAAGVFDDLDGMALAIERAIAIEATDPSGSMATVASDEETVRAVLGALGSPLDVAAINGPTNLVISGLQHELDEAVAAFAARGIECRPLGSLRAGHSRLMASAGTAVARACASMTMRPPERTLISNIDGCVLGPEVARPEYWAEHLRSTVRFADGLETARRLGASAFVELGGSPGLLGLAATTLGDHPGPWIPVLRPRLDGCQSLAEAIGTAYEAGLDPDWPTVIEADASFVHLPTFDLESTPHWSGACPPIAAEGLPDSDHRPVIASGSAPRYRLDWRPAAAGSNAGRDPQSSCAVVGAPTPWRDEVASALSKTGADPLVVQGTLPTDRSVDEVFVLVEPPPGTADEPLGRSDDQLAALEDVSAPFLSSIASTTEWPHHPTRFTLVTCSAQDVIPGERVDPLASAMWGLARTVRLERPELGVRLVDVETLDEHTAGCVASLLNGGETELAIRAGTTHSARLVRIGQTGPVSPPPRLREDRTFLIVGGLGGLGRRAATVLAMAGARHLVLAGRRVTITDVDELQQLVGDDGSVRVRSLDVTDGTAVNALFDELDASGTPVGGIINTAGILDDFLLDGATWDQFRPVLAPKVQGSWNLHQASLRQETPLAFFVLYSSATALHGNLGQAAYATANGYLDGLARARVHLGLPAISIAWGVWGGAGHVDTSPALATSLEDRGFGTIPPEVGDKVLVDSLAEARGQVLILPNDWPRFLRSHHLGQVPLYHELIDDAPGSSIPDAEQGSGLAGELSAADGDDRVSILRAHLLRRVADYVGSPIGADDDLGACGLDSLSAVQLRNELQAALGIQLPARILNQHPTVSEIAAHLVDEVLNGWTPADRPATTPTDDGSALPSDALSIQQHRWLLLTRSAGYGQRIVPVLVHDDLDRPAFAAAIRFVVARHDLLRCRYPDGARIEGLALYDVVPADEVLFVDLAGKVPSDQAAALGTLLDSLREDMPDPAVHAPWTLRCVDLGPGRFLVVVAAQHLEFDGPGLSIFVDELRESYREISRTGRSPDLAPATPYRRFVEHQAAYLSEGLLSDRSFFQGMFSSVPRGTKLPGHPGTAVTTAHPARRRSVSLASWPAVCDVARRSSASPFSVLLASYAALVGEIVGDPWVTISIIRSARTDRTTANAIGPFTMPFPVPIHRAGWSPDALVGQVDRTMASISERSDYPATDLIEATPAFSGLPIDTYFSDVGINFLDYRRPEAKGEPRAEIIEVLGKVDHPLLAGYEFGELRRIPGLHLVAAVRDDELIANYWFHAERFEVETIAAWGRRHQDILQAMIAPDGGRGSER